MITKEGDGMTRDEFMTKYDRRETPCCHNCKHSFSSEGKTCDEMVKEGLDNPWVTSGFVCTLYIKAGVDTTVPQHKAKGPMRISSDDN